MAVSSYRGFVLNTTTTSTDVWQVKIKNRVLVGSMPAVKKSIDWWCDMASIIDPKEFEALAQKSAPANPSEEVFNGFTLKNDTGEPTDWYCLFNGRLIKGAKPALQKHIEATLKARAARQ